MRDSALGNSEPLMAALVLWAFERHLDGRRDHALYLGAGAALMRPEVWPFLGLYGLWLWFRDPQLRAAHGARSRWRSPRSGSCPSSGAPATGSAAAEPRQRPAPLEPGLRRLPGRRDPAPLQVHGGRARGRAPGSSPCSSPAVRYFRRLGPSSERRRDWATLVLGAGGAAWLALVAGHDPGRLRRQPALPDHPDRGDLGAGGRRRGPLPAGRRLARAQRFAPAVARGIARGPVRGLRRGHASR